MATMMLRLINFNNGCALLKFISLNSIAAISWPPPLISQLFSPRLFKAAPFFHSLTVFVWIICNKNHFYGIYKSNMKNKKMLTDGQILNLKKKSQKLKFWSVCLSA